MVRQYASDSRGAGWHIGGNEDHRHRAQGDPGGQTHGEGVVGLGNTWEGARHLMARLRRRALMAAGVATHEGGQSMRGRMGPCLVGDWGSLRVWAATGVTQVACAVKRVEWGGPLGWQGARDGMGGIVCGWHGG